MPPITDEQRSLLENIRQSYPQLYNYPDNEILTVYNKREGQVGGVTPTGMTSIARPEEPKPVEAPKETPKFKPIGVEQSDVGYAERFGKRAWEAFVPFGIYEPELDEAVGFREQLAGALGSGVGFVLGSWPLAVLTGGASIPLKYASGISKVSKIAQKARLAEKAGKKGAKPFEDTLEFLNSVNKGQKLSPELAKLYKISEETPEAFSLYNVSDGFGNFIGKSKFYQRGIESIAAKGEDYVKWAKAMDMGVRNFATFGAYGQLHMKPGSDGDERWNQLKVDTVTAAAFTGLGSLGTRVLKSNATGKERKAWIAGEFLSMFMAGAYMSDLGQTDIPFEERMAHGVTLALMHGVSIGMDKVDRREALVDLFVQNGETIAQAKRRAYGKTADKLENKAIEFVKSSPTLFVDKSYLKTSKKVKDGKTVEKPYIADYVVHRVKEVLKPKKTNDNPKGEPYIVVEHLTSKRGEGLTAMGAETITARGGSKIEKIKGKTIEEAQLKFQEKYTPFRKAAPRELPTQIRKRAKQAKAPLKKELKEATKAQAEARRLRRVRSTEENIVERTYEVVPNTPYMAKKTGNKFTLKLFKKDAAGRRIYRGGAYDRIGNLIDPALKQGFKSKKQAEVWAEKNWKKNEAIESAFLQRVELAKKVQKGSPEYQEYTKARSNAAKELKRNDIFLSDRKQGYKRQSQRLTNIIDTFFPEAGGRFNNLNTYELQTLRGLFRKDGKGDFIPQQINIIPPSELNIGPINKRWMKFTQWANATLPIYTILDAAGPYGKRLATRMMNWSSIQRRHMGYSQSFSKLWNNKFSEKELDIMHKEIDPKFEGARAGSHAKTVEKLKNTEIEVEILTTRKTKDKIYPQMEKQIMSKYDYAKYLIGEFHDRFAINQALYEVKVADTKNRKILGKKEKLEPYLEVRDIDGKKINLREIDSEFDLRAILKKEKGKNSEIEVNGKKVTIGSVPYNHYVKDFFHRRLTDSFWDLINSNKGGIEDYLIIKLMKADKRLTKDEARAQLKLIQGLKENNKLDGQTFSRVAEIDPYIYYGRDNMIIDTKIHYNKEGLPFKKGDKLYDNAKKQFVEVDKAIETYSTDSVNIINRYAEKTAKSIASYGAYGGKEGLSRDIPDKGFYIKEERLRMMRDIERAGGKTPEATKDALWFDKLAETVMRDQINGRNYDHPYLGPKLGPLFEKVMNNSVVVSATIGLSSPLSGIKNLALGQLQLGVLSGRELLRSYTRLLSKPGEFKKSYDLAKEVGALYSGVYDLFIKPATPLRMLYARPKGVKGAFDSGVGLSKEMLLKAGMMRPTEMFNRIIASMMGPRIMEVHLSNLMGVKNFSTRGISKQTSRRVMEELMRFTPKEIDNMIARKKLGNGNPGYNEKQRLWAADRAHTITQGVGDYPYVPYLLGRQGFKPFTLFYRIAYRMTDNIAKNVIKPAVYEGNIWPMMKYVGLSVGAGEGLYSLYRWGFGEERKNKFKDAPAQYWSNFVRAEGLGIMSNAFDEYGNAVSDAYTPVVIRNYLDITKEFMHYASGEKGFADSVESGLKKTVALYSASQRVYKNLIKDTEKRVVDSKRRQSQFTKVYFPDYDTGIDASDALNRNSPYYETIRNVFWTDDEKAKTFEYETALNYLAHVIARENKALAKNDMMAYKEAKKRLKNIVSRMRPIPSSWRERRKGDKTTKYRIYMSALPPELAQEEKELEILYKRKLAEFRRAASKARMVK